MSSSPSLVPADASSSHQHQHANQNQQQTAADSEAPSDDKASWIGKTTARMSTAWLCSMFFHLAILIGLALYTITQLVIEEPIALAMGPVTDEPMLEMPLDIEDFEEEELEENVEELTEETFDESLLQTDIIADLPVESAVVEMSDFGDLSSELVELGGGEGEGLEGFESNTASTFFKKSGGPLPKTVVYIVDNSNSMTGRSPQSQGYGRMETALVELAKSVNSLRKDQQFYIILYSDMAYGLYYPQTEPGYVRATNKNKLRVQQWLETIECCLLTRGKEAFALARQLNPELIYLLGDGSFGDRADRKLVANPLRNTRIEALGMNLDPAGKKSFESIAKAHGGTYRDVGLTEEGKAILRAYGPRKANNLPGPIWGPKIPVRKKK